MSLQYDETPPEEWSRGLVGFKPTAVFDVAQTEGEPLPELETAATGDAGDLVSTLTDAADDLGVTVKIVDADEWKHGEAMGVCRYQYRLRSNRSSRRRRKRIRRIWR